MLSPTSDAILARFISGFFFFMVQHLPAPNEILSSSGIVVVRDRVQKKCDCVCPLDGRPLLCCRVPSFGARMSCLQFHLPEQGENPKLVSFHIS